MKGALWDFSIIFFAFCLLVIVYSLFKIWLGKNRFELDCRTFNSSFITHELHALGNFKIWFDLGLKFGIWIVILDEIDKI